MNIKVTTTTGRTVEFTGVLALAFLALFAGVLWAADWLDKDLFKTLAQGLLNILIAVAAFYFGSSQGSQKKDETIATALNPPGDPK